MLQDPAEYTPTHRTSPQLKASGEASNWGDVRGPSWGPTTGPFNTAGHLAKRSVLPGGL